VATFDVRLSLYFKVFVWTLRNDLCSRPSITLFLYFPALAGMQLKGADAPQPGWRDWLADMTRQRKARGD
jgi:hypothetical protein